MPFFLLILFQLVPSRKINWYIIRLFTIFVLHRMPHLSCAVMTIATYRSTEEVGSKTLLIWSCGVVLSCLRCAMEHSMAAPNRAPNRNLQQDNHNGLKKLELQGTQRKHGLFSRTGCCMCHVIASALLGASSAIYVWSCFAQHRSALLFMPVMLISPRSWTAVVQ